MADISRSLHDRIYGYLTLRLAEVLSELDQLQHAVKISNDQWTKGRLAYARHKESTLRWLMMVIPKRYHDIVTFDSADLGEVESYILRQAKDVF